MAAIPIGEPGRKRRKRIAANRARLFVFITNRDMPCTNNVSERNLRPSVIFRKVTNGFRCESLWDATAAGGVACMEQQQFRSDGVPAQGRQPTRPHGLPGYLECR